MTDDTRDPYAGRETYRTLESVVGKDTRREVQRKLNSLVKGRSPHLTRSMYLELEALPPLGDPDATAAAIGSVEWYPDGQAYCHVLVEGRPEHCSSSWQWIAKIHLTKGAEALEHAVLVFELMERCRRVYRFFSAQSFDRFALGRLDIGECGSMRVTRPRGTE